MKLGVEKIFKSVAATLGPMGRNVAIEQPTGAPYILNDGATVSKEFELAQPIENIGVRLVRQAAMKTNDDTGDGTSTSIVLGAALINEASLSLATGANPVNVSRGIEKAVENIVPDIQAHSTVLNSTQELIAVASLSAGCADCLGKLIAEAMDKVGRLGVINIQQSKTSTDDLIVVEGMSFERGFFTHYFATDSETLVTEYKKCRILLVDANITKTSEIVGFLEFASKNNCPLLILANDISDDVLTTLIVNKLRNSVKVVAVKAPGFGQNTTQYLEDIAILTGGTLFRHNIESTLEDTKFASLGIAAKVIVDKRNCTIVGDGSQEESVNARLRQIRALREVTNSAYEKENLSERLARLSSGVAIILVGAETETELRDRKLRAEDALCAARAAVEGGIVVGGGCTMARQLIRAKDIRDIMSNNEESLGAEIVLKAMTYPIKTIADNSGVNGAFVLEKMIVSYKEQNFGYNAATGKYEDFMSSGIIDPAKVVCCALKNACSVARTFMLSDAVITNIDPPTTLQQGDGVETLAMSGGVF